MSTPVLVLVIVAAAAWVVTLAGLWVLARAAAEGDRKQRSRVIAAYRLAARIPESVVLPDAPPLFAPDGAAVATAESDETVAAATR